LARVMSLRQYVARRLILCIFVLFGVSIITFFLARVVPSDPAALWVGPHARREEVERARKMLGLDKPLWVQYLIYIRNLLSGDLGISIYTHRPVLDDILMFLPASLELIVSGIFIGLILGIPLGVISAMRRDTLVDHVSRVYSIGGVSIPTFWLGMMLQLLFFKYLGILPAGGRVSSRLIMTHPITRRTGFYLIDTIITGNWIAFRDALTHLILPAMTLAAYPTGLVARMVRSTMVEVLEEDYIRTARAYGLPERVIAYLYALKNAIGPMITVLVLCFAYSLVETFLIEYVFDWPGLGRYASLAILATDYPAIMGITLFVTITYVSLNLVVDILLAFIDPRIRLR